MYILLVKTIDFFSYPSGNQGDTVGVASLAILLSFLLTKGNFTSKSHSNIHCSRFKIYFVWRKWQKTQVSVIFKWGQI